MDEKPYNREEAEKYLSALTKIVFGPRLGRVQATEGEKLWKYLSRDIGQ